MGRGKGNKEFSFQAPLLIVKKEKGGDKSDRVTLTKVELAKRTAEKDEREIHEAKSKIRKRAGEVALQLQANGFDFWAGFLKAANLDQVDIGEFESLLTQNDRRGLLDLGKKLSTLKEKPTRGL